MALAQNLTRAIGVSNFVANHLNAVLTKATVKPAVNQMQLYVGHHDDATIGLCKQHGITYMAYSPLGVNNFNPKSVLVNPVVQKVAAAHNVSAAQVGIAWIAQQGMTLTTGSSSEQYDKEDLNTDSFTLTGAEMKTLSDVSCKITDFQPPGKVVCSPTGKQVLQCSK